MQAAELYALAARRYVEAADGRRRARPRLRGGLGSLPARRARGLLPGRGRGDRRAAARRDGRAPASTERCSCRCRTTTSTCATASSATPSASRRSACRDRARPTSTTYRRRREASRAAGPAALRASVSPAPRGPTRSARSPLLSEFARAGDKLWFYGGRGQMGCSSWCSAELPELTVVLNHLGFWPTTFHSDEHGRPRFDSGYTAGEPRRRRGPRTLPARLRPLHRACTPSPGSRAPTTICREVTSTAPCRVRAAGRVLLGTDFPWIRDEPGYRETVAAVDAHLDVLDDADRAAVRGGNAMELFWLRRADLYRTMLTIRRFEERVVDLVNANEIAGVTHEYVGQEAVAVGVCAALDADDVITSTHRGHGHLIAKGADVRRMYGRAARPRRRPEPRPRRLDAHRRRRASASTARTASSPPARRSPPARPGRSRSTDRGGSPSRSSATAASTRACCTRR